MKLNDIQQKYPNFRLNPKDINFLKINKNNVSSTYVTNDNLNFDIPSHNFDIKFYDLYDSTLEESNNISIKDDVKEIIEILKDNVSVKNKKLLESIEVSDSISDILSNNEFFNIFLQNKKGGNTDDVFDDSESESVSESIIESISEKKNRAERRCK